MIYVELLECCVPYTRALHLEVLGVNGDFTEWPSELTSVSELCRLNGWSKLATDKAVVLSYDPSWWAHLQPASWFTSLRKALYELDDVVFVGHLLPVADPALQHAWIQRQTAMLDVPYIAANTRAFTYHAHDVLLTASHATAKRAADVPHAAAVLFPHTWNMLRYSLPASPCRYGHNYHAQQTEAIVADVIAAHYSDWKGEKGMVVRPFADDVKTDLYVRH